MLLGELWSDGRGWQRGVAVPQILEESRTAQGHRRPVLAVVCCGRDKIDDDDDDDDGDGDDDDDDDDEETNRDCPGMWSPGIWANTSLIRPHYFHAPWLWLYGWGGTLCMISMIIIMMILLNIW